MCYRLLYTGQKCAWSVSLGADSVQRDDDSESDSEVIHTLHYEYFLLKGLAKGQN